MSNTPIADHGFLSDGHTCALVTRDGSVDWLCLPRFDSPAVLARLLDDSAGHLSLRPADPDAEARRRYRRQSLVLETVWICETGTLVVLDCLALGKRERGHDLGQGSPGALLRHARCDSGYVDVVVEWAPRPEFGLVHPLLTVTSEGVRAEGGSTVLLLSTTLPMAVAAMAAGTGRLDEGQSLGVAGGAAGLVGAADRQGGGADRGGLAQLVGSASVLSRA